MMSAADFPIERKRMADGTVKPPPAATTATLHTDLAAHPYPPAAPAAAMPKIKPAFRPAKDDTKPTLRDPISRSDPIVTEQAMLRLPPFPRTSTSTFTRF